MDAQPLLPLTVISFLVSTVLLLALRPLAFAIGLVDKPGGRKLHEGEVPVIGGLAMFGGLVVAVAFGADLGHHGVALLIAAAFMVFIGALDDRFDLPAMTRLLAHIAAAVTLVVGTGFVVADFGDLLGLGTISLGVAGPVFTVVACIALINAFNMLDGLDGLAGGVALLGFMGLGTVAVAAGAMTSTLISLGLVGSLFGFLLFNVPARNNRKIRTFMGDAGSTLLGFVLAGVGLILVQPDRADMAPVLLVWMVPIPIFELFFTTGRRIVQRVSPMHADADHFHHRLTRAGFSVRAVFLLYFVASGLSVAIALVASRAGVADAVMFWAFLASFAGWMLLVRNASKLARLLPPDLRHTVHSPI